MGNWGWSQLGKADKNSILDGVRNGCCYKGPFHLELQPTGRCNLDCFFCGTRNTRRDADLDVKLARSVLRQFRNLGGRFITLNGGGEPLFNYGVAELMEMIIEEGCGIDNLTTNGVLLDDAIADCLTVLQCRQVIVSLNAGNAADYSRMMQASDKLFHQVCTNIERLVDMKRRRRTIVPKIIIQFLVYKNNFNSVPEMYALGTRLGADAMIFNTITNLPAGLTMDEACLIETVRLFAEILQEDHFRRIGAIHSFDKDLHDMITHAYGPNRYSLRGWMRAYSKAFHLLTEYKSDLEGCLALFWVRSFGRSRFQALQSICDCCLAPWHTLTMRADGTVPVCCVLHDITIANLRDYSLKEIWFGPPMSRIRGEIRRTLVEGERWKFEPDTDNHIQPMCAMNCDIDSRCRFRSDFFCQDYPFLRKLHSTITHIRGS